MGRGPTGHTLLAKSGDGGILSALHGIPGHDCPASFLWKHGRNGPTGRWKTRAIDAIDRRIGWDD